jgi:D-alanyl-lipoteichoic acid acyltransferase DltB (MBOAT superfamily)
MAIGLALLFGIDFPLNFDSPYKARSLIDFWRRWHITLSRFLRDYLYIPLGGNRRGPRRRYLNLMITMVLGGLWHGASWNFALWGALHGFGLLVNHIWHDFSQRRKQALPDAIALTLTLLFVVLAWVPFRADSFEAAALMWKAMVTLQAGAEPLAVNRVHAGAWIVLLSGIALFAPNAQEIMGGRAERGAQWLRWQPGVAWAIVFGGMLGIATAATFQRPTVFLYFRF